MFRPLSPEADFVALETEELERWRVHQVFERSVSGRRDAAPWVFYEGPPTANNRPGLHHVWARVYKDLFCRFRTMRGFLVERRAGWDTHGLPVEVEVEKRLGVNSKRQIEEEVGIAEFVRLCRESVLGYVQDWNALTERIGYWTDLEHAYWTFDRSYIESVWWYLKQLFERGLLYEDLKVVPYCPRCGTALSSHELGQPEVYTDEEDESAYVKLTLVDPDPTVVGDARWLVVWTTTPWTLLSNTGVAAHPDLDYVVVDGMIVAEALADEVLGQGAAARATWRVRGRQLEGLRYERPLDVVAVPPSQDTSRGWRVVLAEFVTTDEGTGLVHLAPAFGEIDREVGKARGLPTLNPVGPDGRFTPEAGPRFAGRAVRESNDLVNAELEARGLLVRRHLYTHAYPHCWRCGTALIYWGKPSWYVATSSRKHELIAANQRVDWHPPYIKEGRFGEWLANNVDWALSRDRYWGTPLPIWRCGEGHLVCVESMTELAELAGRDLADVDPHRPTIDEVVFPCPACAELAPAHAAGGSATGDESSDPAVSTARRVEPVIDAWFDSGSMPAAQVGYPHAVGSKEAMRFPADFIVEAIDQTRGWFYSLLAVNDLVFGEAPYRHVMVLGHIVDADGRKMSKSLGNVIDPWDLVNSRGADPLRWWMFSQGSPWTATRVSTGAIDASMRDMLLTLWNTVSFFTTYASLNGFDPADPAVPSPPSRGALDRWARSRVMSTLEVVTTALDAYEPLEAATALGRLVDDLSNWYVRRSRRRFWRTDPDALPTDALAAQATLYEALVAVSLMLAPFCPFVADRLWRELGVSSGEGDSVHLQTWPALDEAAIDPDLEAQMALAVQLSSLGRAARGEAGVKVRQPLSRALVFLAPGSPAILADVVADELNVDQVVEAQDLAEAVSLEITPNFRVLGPRLGEAVKEVRGALARLDAPAVAAALEAGGTVTVQLSSGAVALGPDELEVRVRGQSGFAVSREGSAVVALDLRIDEDLRRRGLVREVVRHVQDLRKARGLEVSDRIRLWLSGVDAALFAPIGREVLAVEVAQGPGCGQAVPLDVDGGTHVEAWLEKA
ncbi:MAG: class I tRNA ligase family protein [Actinomycetota bacterium]|nr:class I tRNA ligase family protein [Actinomycetota bacterium]